MTRRITRAKQQIKDSGIPFRLPAPAERTKRLAAVLHVLYLIFTEGYAATTGASLHRAELSTEAIRLTRMVYRVLPDDGEVAGLLALMLLTDARRAARTTAMGELVPLAEQDRSLWNTDYIAEGVALITDALPRGTAGPYQLQAAIAAIHDEASSTDQTDWAQIKALYELLLQMSNNPMVALNHVVAVAMADGPAAGLQRLDSLAEDKQLAEDHRLYAVRAHLLEMTGDKDAAREAYRAAARRATNLAQHRYLNRQAAKLNDADHS
jgi:predicted RNA polymerase sigma factor